VRLSCSLVINFAANPVSYYNNFIIHDFVCILSHYDPDDMESMRLCRTIYRLHKKLWLLVKKPGFLSLIHPTYPCDYRKLRERYFNFIQVSLLSNIFYYIITLVIGNRFSPQPVVLEEVMYERGNQNKPGSCGFCIWIQTASAS
jgi:hypothetical protein